MTCVPLLVPARLDGAIWDSNPPENRRTLTGSQARALSPLDRARALTLERHEHGELELNLVTRGTGEYLCRSARLGLRAGTLLWIPPGVPHVLHTYSSELRLWVISLRLPVLAKVLPAHELEELLAGRDVHARQLASPASQRLGELFAEVISARERRATFNLGLAYAAARAWGETRACQASLRDLHPAVARAAVLLRDSEENLRLPELAKRCGLSPDHLSRVFAAQMGLPLLEYRTLARVDRFRALFGRGRRYSLSEAAQLAGFGSYAQFQRAFKRQLGCSPAEYARALRRK